MDDVAELQRDPGAFDPPGKGQHLLDELSPAPGAAFHHVKHRQALRRGIELLQQADAHHDRSKEIVEVVGDAAGEGADALHPLGAEKLLLELLALGDVGLDQENRLWPALGVPQQGPAALQDKPRAVFRDLPDFPAPDAIPQHQLAVAVKFAAQRGLAEQIHHHGVSLRAQLRDFFL